MMSWNWFSSTSRQAAARSSPGKRRPATARAKTAQVSASRSITSLNRFARLVRACEV